jgi:hypothetical protein
MPTKINLIPPTFYQESLCDLFAKESVKNIDSYYSSKGQGDINKLIAYAYQGKMAEFAVYNTLVSLGKYNPVTFPDIEIYEIDNRSFDADIKASDKLVHVKSFMKVDGYKTSWLFSDNDPLCEQPLPEDMVALVEIELPKKFSGYFISAGKLVGLYKPPLFSKTIAKAIYEEDILKLN